METIPTVGIIYKLIVGDDYYIGSTTEGLQRRITTHYKGANASPERRLYKAIEDLGGWKDVKCEVLETLVVADQLTLFKKEDEHIRLEDPHCLNTVRAVLSEEERKEQKKAVKRQCWARWVEDPAFRERERQKAKAAYNRKRNDPEFMERRRKTALESYHRRKNGTTQSS